MVTSFKDNPTKNRSKDVHLKDVLKHTTVILRCSQRKLSSYIDRGTNNVDWGKRRKDEGVTKYTICDIIYRRSYKQSIKDVHLENVFNVDNILPTSGVSNAIDETDSILLKDFQVLIVIGLK